ncbi:methionine ABC transporter ATP-binding protein [Frigoribacterium faeni]|uniref:ABC-type methionine transport system ATPase subunit n=1 Tax=Frigoribacterium faeni TaxID=145483 RepID=A0A7W3JFG1_9MICO|nr:ATP-binding cassette domain-containing protein [Frigoribacterium faeni]MBA8811878.1 ABC-type methionine transport system ATPase subunit [Frigoribacterium faeni]BFF12861.1 ATP-binding cassette domain-containing protein [Microbacterium flavescens]GEK84586.1 methionine import ATP-binding protein MetN [Frigoribacterium faeni]
MISLDQLTKVYETGSTRSTVLDRVDFSVATGEIAAVVGPSGAGKSTLAQCVTLLERPTSGSVVVNGDDLTRLGERDLRVARRRIGTVFQSDGLFGRRTAAQNVALPLEYLGVTKAETRRRVAELLDRVGLGHRADARPHELSGGQRQRVGIARALALRPTVLLSDEATSGLDPASTASIVALLRELRDDLGLSILFITHEMDTVLQIADSAARLDHGRIVERGRVLDLLRDPASDLGAALRPARPAAEAPGGTVTWRLDYVSPDVPADWPALIGRAVGSTVALLGASIESLGGASVGHATIAVPEAAGPRLPGVAAALGLAARPLGAPSSAPDHEVPAAEVADTAPEQELVR